jgi:AcrR family transcriptional regulator
MVQQERARRTRQHVLDAAAEEFSAHGYSHTTLGAVAQRIGMTKGALYGHFPSKDQLADAIVQYADDLWKATVREANQADCAPLRTLGALTCLLAGLLRSDTRPKAAFRLVADRVSSGATDHNLLDDVRAHMGELVRCAQRDGEVTRRYPPEAITELLLAVVFAVPAETPPMDGGSHPARWIEAVWEILQSALRCVQPA